MDLVDRIQAAYPRIWHAAHRHAGREDELSERDQRLLAHLTSRAVEPRALAAHLKLAPSTLSEHLGDLEVRGLVRRERNASDGRRVWVHLTDLGRSCRRRSGPLDPDLLQRAIERLDRPEAVVGALEALADALR